MIFMLRGFGVGTLRAGMALYNNSQSSWNPAQ